MVVHTQPGGLRTGLAWRLALDSRAALPLRRTPRGFPVDEPAQPALYALIRDATRRAGRGDRQYMAGSR